MERGRVIPLLTGNEVSLLAAVTIVFLMVLVDKRWKIVITKYFGLAFTVLIGGVVIIVMHRDNINRLVNGTERKIGQKAEKPTSPRQGSKA